MNKDLISVIVPIYNVEQYLERCIDSILQQTYENIEIILVNDGSLDNCGEICDRYKEIDDRIKVVHKKNGGLSDARNAGLDVAIGTYVIFIDSDDYVEKDLIEESYDYMVNNNLDLVSFNYRKVDEEGKVIEESVLDIDESIYDIDEIGIDNYIIKNIYTYKHGIEAWHKIYKMSIIKERNLKFTYNNLIFAEDLLFNLSYLVHVKRLGTMSKVYYNYLIRNTSIMGQPKKELFIRYRNLFQTLEEYWEKYDSKIVEVIPLGYFIWLIGTIKIKLNEGTDTKLITDEFKEISDTNFFKKVRNKILNPNTIFKYLKLCPQKMKHGILLYLTAVLSLIKNEKTVVNIVKKYIV